MSTLLRSKGRNRSSQQFIPEYRDYLNPFNKTNSIYYRDTIKQFCPHQRFVDHRPNPYRPFVKPPTYYNNFNNPTEKDSYVPCFQNYPKRELRPLVTRQDLSKYLNSDGYLYKHQRPCNSCSRINDGNYGRNYYTISQKSFPFINGNFTGKNFGLTHGFKTPYARSTKRFRYKIKDYDNFHENNQFNNEYNLNENEKINLNENEKDNEKENAKNENNIESNKQINTIESFNTSPKNRRTFHKVQIFNHYKPFMVDDFKNFADYE